MMGNRRTILIALAVWIGGAGYTPAGWHGVVPARSTVIVLDKDASDMEVLGAKEIRRYLYLRTGEVLPIAEIASPPARAKAVIIVARKDRSVLRTFEVDADFASGLCGLGEQHYWLKTMAGDGGQRIVAVAGGDDVSTLYGAYRFVEHFGVRFYLHGDTLADTRIALRLPTLDEKAAPLFALRGIVPFHNFPEGPDWWCFDDYKAILAQLAKMRMNFIGLHTYPEGQNGPEPTVWIGLMEDTRRDGTVRFSSDARWISTRNSGCWGYKAQETSEFLFGAAQLFDRDAYAGDVMRGMERSRRTLQQKNELFNRVGAMFKEVFGFAQKVGLKTSVGTESPLHIPDPVKKHLKAMGKDPSDPAVVQDIYQGMFERIRRAHPLDYYWCWTVEGWSNEASKDEGVTKVSQDLLAAVAAAKKVDPPLALAICGWALGTHLDDVLPKEIPFSSLNPNIGKGRVEAKFGTIAGRPKWAIPWLEDDPGLYSPQLWVGRVRKDAADALKYGCTGLLGIHWRTRILGPNVSALAQAAWDQSMWEDSGFRERPETNITRGDEASRDHTAETAGGELPWSLPADDFYRDWALHQFGGEVAEQVAEVFARQDGHLPEPVSWRILSNPKPWAEVKKIYAFVDELAEMLLLIKGDSQRERFSYWLNSFRYMREIARVGCTLGQLERVMKQVGNETDPDVKRQRAREEALPLRIQLVRQWGDMVKFLLQTVSNSGEMGSVASMQLRCVGHWNLLAKHDEALANALGEPLPAQTRPWMDYRGSDRIIVPTARTSLEIHEDLRLKVIVLARQKPTKVILRWRLLGGIHYDTVAATHIARGVYSVTLPAEAFGKTDFEYHVVANWASGRGLQFPASAPTINHTVVVIGEQIIPRPERALAVLPRRLHEEPQHRRRVLRAHQLSQRDKKRQYEHENCNLPVPIHDLAP